MSGCSTPALLRIKPPAFPTDNQLSNIGLILSVFSYTTAVHFEVCKLVSILRISSIQFRIEDFSCGKNTSRCAVAAAPVLWRNHSTPTWAARQLQGWNLINVGGHNYGDFRLFAVKFKLISICSEPCLWPCLWWWWFLTLIMRRPFWSLRRLTGWEHCWATYLVKLTVSAFALIYFVMLCNIVHSSSSVEKWIWSSIINWVLTFQGDLASCFQRQAGGGGSQAPPAKKIYFLTNQEALCLLLYQSRVPNLSAYQPHIRSWLLLRPFTPTPCY